MKIRALRVLFVAIVLLAGRAEHALSGETTVAVATNFLQAATEISGEFTRQTGHEVVLVAGASGKLASQILAGAPFDVLLSADQDRPALLVEKGIVVPESRFTYARGALILLSLQNLPLKGDTIETLDETAITRLALANPKLAPYGRAAEQALQRLGFLDKLKGRIVYGENVGQAFAMVASGNATAGITARSQLSALPDVGAVHWIEVPAHLYDPVLQDAVLIRRASENPAAKAFMAYLRDGKAAGIMRAFGYEAGGE